MVARGEGQWLTAAQLALVNNGLRRYDVALLAAEQASEYPDERGLATWARAELIEAAARTGHTEQGTASLARLSGSNACQRYRLGPGDRGSLESPFE